jgi:hypothetical protein
MMTTARHASSYANAPTGNARPLGRRANARHTAAALGVFHRGHLWKTSQDRATDGERDERRHLPVVQASDDGYTDFPAPILLVARLIVARREGVDRR